MTSEQIAVPPICTASDIGAVAQAARFNAGFPPFLRGPYPTMYVARPWTVRQYAGFSTAPRAMPSTAQSCGGPDGFVGGVRSRHASGLRLRTIRGWWAMSARPAWPIDSILDMKQLFDSIPLREVSVSMTMNGAVLPIIGVLTSRRHWSKGEAPELAGHDPE